MVQASCSNSSSPAAVALQHRTGSAAAPGQHWLAAASIFGSSGRAGDRAVCIKKPATATAAAAAAGPQEREPHNQASATGGTVGDMDWDCPISQGRVSCSARPHVPSCQALCPVLLGPMSCLARSCVLSCKDPCPILLGPVCHLAGPWLLSCKAIPFFLRCMLTAEPHNKPH